MNNSVYSEKERLYYKRLDKLAKETGIPELIKLVDSIEFRIELELFGENPTKEDLINIYELYYKED